MNYFRCGGGRSTHTATKIDVAKTPLATFESNVSGLYLPEILAYIQATQSGTGDPSPINPRVINGVSEVTTACNAINQWDEQWESGAINTSTGQNSTSNSHIRSVNYIPAIAGATYYNVGYALFVFQYDANKNFLEQSVKQVGTFTVRNDCRFIRFFRTATTYSNDISINYPSTDHDYHPYTGTTATTSLGGTYYGGYLNVTTGVLTIDKIIKDLGTLDYTYVASGNRFTNSGSGIAGEVKAPASDSQLANIMCDKLKPLSLTTLRSSSDDYLIAIGDTGRISIRWTATQDPIVFKTAITGTNLVYELATPQTVQLTPAEITQLFGQNNVFCSSGDVAVKYWKID